MANPIPKLLVLIPALVAGMPFAPIHAEDYDICLTEDRADWPDLGVPRRRFETFHVIPDPDDKENRLMQAIIDGVLNEGFAATFGPLDQVPDDVDIIITFEAHWTWNLGDQLRKSIIFFRYAPTFRVLLVATRQLGPGLASMPTVEIARMINRLNSADVVTPLCWSEEPHE